ncbi:hypothetical protein ACP179_08960 [Xenorhabdus stockiae]|uniref:hypothetical protein n=1 Tax=Xenorhabdus stockiae TaxID=351614 RepID=UPI003CE8888D
MPQHIENEFVVHHVIDEESVTKIEDIKDLTEMLSHLFYCQSEKSSGHKNTASGYLFRLIYKELEEAQSRIYQTNRALDVVNKGTHVEVSRRD